MTVIPLRRPQEPATYGQPSPEAREAFASLDGKVGALRRCFSGSFVTSHAKAEIDRLCEQVRIEAQRVWRLSR